MLRTGLNLDTTYDALGRVYQVSNPYHPGETLYWTTSLYDALGRVTDVTTSGDSATVTTSYSGNQSTVMDQAGKKRTNTSDALGRLTQVVEDPGAGKLNYTTTYGYDALDDLTSVAQGSQTRTFTYDAVRRLLTATNPESGTVSYSYDNADNLISRTDARQRITCYGTLSGSLCTSGYDGLNRVTVKSYSDGTPTVTYTYDTGATKGVDRLTKVSNANSVTAYTEYDEMGRVKQSNQQTNGQTYAFSYTYNLAGAQTKETYPSEREVTTGYDGANQANALSGTVGAQATNYVSSASYWVVGQQSGAHANMMTFGNNVVSEDWYDNRRHPYALTRRADSTQNSYLQGLQYVWNLNGTLGSATEGNGNGIPYNSMQWLSQSSGYDGVNRLNHADDKDANQTTNWPRDFGYDQYGNMSVASASGIAAPGQPVAYDATKNQIQQPAGTLCQNSTLYDCAGISSSWTARH